MVFGMPTLLELDTLKENVALCASLGLSFVELNMNLPQYGAETLTSRLAACRRLCERSGVFFTLHLDENLNFADFDPNVRQAYLQTAAQAIRFAGALGCPVVNLHMPRGVYFTLPDQKVWLFEKYNAEFMRAVAAFRDLCVRETGDANIKICIENTGGYLPFQQTAIDFLLQAPCFALTWDIGHSHAAGDVDAPFLLRRKDRLAHFHIHDAVGKQNHLALGAGEIDLATRLKTAKEQNCRCVVETKTAAALKTSVQYLRERGFCS